LANRILKDPVQINIAISKPAAGILQQAYVVYDNQKMDILKQVLLDEKMTSVIVFASTKDKVKDLEREMQRAGFAAKGFHSDLEQNDREIIMREFKNRSLRIIIGTDILSRGIDVEGINLVVNYDAPPDPEDYIHRIGRTARADSTGTAITFINDKDQQKFFRIESLIGNDIPKLPIPTELGEGPLYQPELKRQKTFRHKKPFKGKRK
jgi:superfamily II DNA/RNA helicase